MKYIYFFLFLNIVVVEAQIPYTSVDGGPSCYSANGNDLFNGCPNAHPGIVPQLNGRVIYFLKQNQDISQQQILMAPDGFEEDRFGYGLSSEGDFLAVGATADYDDTSYGTGKLDIFKKNGGTFELFQTISVDDASFGDAFGKSYFYGDDLFISATKDEPSGQDANLNSGSVYRYHFDGTNWVFAQK